jgi:hypothetical protein
MKHAPFIFHLRRPDWPLPISQASARGARRSASLVKLRETGGIETTPFLAGRLTVGRRKLLCNLGRVRQRTVAGSIWLRGEAADGSSGGSRNSVAPSSGLESVMVEGLPRAETAKSSSNSSP